MRYLFYKISINNDVWRGVLRRYKNFLSAGVVLTMYISFPVAPTLAQTVGGAGGYNAYEQDSASLGGEPEHSGTHPLHVNPDALGGGGGGAGGGAGGNGSEGQGHEFGGKGGDGGAHGLVITTIAPAGESITGDQLGTKGDDGAPGDDAQKTYSSGAAGGGGGAGGYGLVVKVGGTITNMATISGGAGGNGGDGGRAIATVVAGVLNGSGGQGGGGGVGVWMTAKNISLINGKIISGAAGGKGGETQLDAALAGNSTRIADGGNGGAGVYSSDPTGTSVENQTGAAIQGGAGGDGGDTQTGVNVIGRPNQDLGNGAGGARGGEGIFGVLRVDNDGTIIGGAGGNGGVGDQWHHQQTTSTLLHEATGGNGGAGVVLPSLPVAARVTNNANGVIQGGRGGNGGNAATEGSKTREQSIGGNGGGGVEVTVGAVITNVGQIAGGDGGNGGTTLASDSSNGRGGKGGGGVYGNEFTVNNSGNIQAGQGGVGGSGGGGDGGDGINGGGLTIINSGTIQAGQGGASGSSNFAGGNEGLAIHFLAAQGPTHANTLEIHNGSNIVGKVVAEANIGGNVFILGGDDDATFGKTLSATIDHTSDYQGFGKFQKAGTSTWTLETRYDNRWDILDGSLKIDDQGSLGDNTIIAASGSSTVDRFLIYDLSGGVTQTFNGLLSGEFGLRKEGDGTLELTNNNNVVNLGIELNGGVISTNTVDALGNRNLSFDGGTLRLVGWTPSSMQSLQTVTLNPHGGTFDIADQLGSLSIAKAITGVGGLTKMGSGALILTGDSNYMGGTTILGGAILLGNRGTKGSVEGTINVSQNAQLIISRGDNAATPYDFDNKTTGDGQVVVDGPGTVKFSNEDSTYSGGTKLADGTLRIDSDKVLGAGGLIFDSGTLSIGSNISIDHAVNVLTSGIFDTDHDLTLTGPVDGASISSFDKIGNGRLTFDSSADTTQFFGTANVKAGTMEVNSQFGGGVNVDNGGALGGEGSVGRTEIAGGGTLVGTAGKTMTFGNGLVLDADSTVHITIGATPTNPPMFEVNGDLILDGTLEVETNQSTAGVYQVFHYSGTSTDNGFQLGTIQNVANQNDWSLQIGSGAVNLVHTNGVAYHYWDGSNTTGGNGVAGGNGTWNATNTNWTSDNGAQNGIWDDDALAIFEGAAGTVAVQGPVNASGLVFQTNGYVINGDPLTLVQAGGQAPIIQVGDISEASKSSMTATVDTVLHGTDGLNKTGNGTLILTKNADYRGTTTVSGGTLQLGDGGTQGLVNTDIILAGNHFDDSVLVFNHSGPINFDHSISGVGEVIQRGTGITTFSASNSFSDGLTVENGTAKAGVAVTAFGSGRVKIDAGATLDLADFSETVGGLIGDKDGDGNISLGSGTLTLNQDFNDQFSGAISGTGGIVKNENGKLTLFGRTSYSGVTAVNGGSLVQGAKDAFSNTSAYTVANGATLDFGGFATGVRSLENVGTVDFGGMGGTTLTIAGDYVGGGRLVMSTVLGADNSTTDLMRVGGNTSGTTSVVVKNRGGLGAATVNGIELIDIAGNSGGTFNLQGDYTTKDGQQAILTSSAYAYTLQKGDASGSNTKDWYLVSQYTRSNPDGPNPPDCDDPNGCPENPTNPSGPSRFSPAAPVYTSYAASMQALNQLPTLQQRRGDRYLNKSGSLRGSSEAGETDDRAIWARIEGAHNRLEPNTTAGHVQQDINTVIMQAGVDGQFYEDESGRLIAGITGQYGNGRARTSSNFDDVNGGGELNTQGWGLGATITWYGNDGFYVDGQAQANWYKTDLRFGGGNNGLTNDNNGFGYAFSVESGKRFDIDENWSLTPQAQLMFSSVDFDTFSDSYGATVSNRDGNSLNGRLGLAANYANSWQGADSRMVNANVYGIANLYQEFLGGTSINYGGTRMKVDQDRTWAGVGFGGTYAWADNKYSVYGEGTVNTSLNHFADSYAVKGNVGFKVNW
ncbi:autotransporter outer membrane beta-barrel domain-containing protein [Ochrobactrum teleogrylli]|uniref:Autotransporter outer membrane beta-barrel domain-containing protein n=1 Tax=Ochrobactrum teleogrylli TaxID=2479765 RepID=A0ABY2Y0H4_9HYPH|nr:autotransporter outer membrane beta-barrel domain-containing protein [[Ochrobactrum] teleogrylli]TNV10827.1 autotransporter outer membrane beta-barrel domain-containing protein [[Ochrobactrum] teleogrylli]